MTTAVLRSLSLALPALILCGCPADNLGSDGGDLACCAADLRPPDAAGPDLAVDLGGADLLTVDAAPGGHGLYFYVASPNPGNVVTAISVEADTGVVTVVDEDPVNAGVQGGVKSGNNPLAAAATPDGRYLYLPNSGDSTISAYTIDPASGRLGRIDADGVTAGVQDFPLAAQTHLTSLAIDPAGRFLYTANAASNDVSSFAINGATGALTPVIASVPAGLSPRRVLLDPTGTLLFAINNGEPSISAYTIAGGAPTRVDQDGGTPGVQDFTFVHSGGIYAVVHPSKPVLYMSASQANQIDAVSFTAAGVLSTLVSVPAGTFPIGVAVDPTGTFLFAANYGSFAISGYRLGVDGAPTALPDTMTVSMGRGATFEPSGKFFYLIDDGGALRSFALDPTTGSLGAPDNQAINAGGTYEIGVAVTTF